MIWRDESLYYEPCPSCSEGHHEGCIGDTAIEGRYVNCRCSDPRCPLEDS